MKAIILILAMLMATASHATPTTDSTQITITLKARHHAFIISLMPSRGQADEIRYITQVSQALQMNADGQPVDTAQQITVTVSCDLVKRLYLVIGSQQERISSILNEEIKDALLPQLFQRPLLLQEIGGIAAQNGQDTSTLVQSGFDFIHQVKQTQ